MKFNYDNDSFDDYEVGYNGGIHYTYLDDPAVEHFDIHDDFVEPRCDSFFERYADSFIYAEAADRAFSAARVADERRHNHAYRIRDNARRAKAKRVTHSARNCDHCGTSYVPARNTSRFCTASCRSAARHAKA